MNQEQLLLYAVTDRRWGGTHHFYEQIEQALKGGVTILQLREKCLDEMAFLQEAVTVKRICDRYKVPLIINDHVEIAIKSGAAGVHVGIEDMSVADIRKRVGKDFIIGATAKTVSQACKAEMEGADYLGVGAVFPSLTKKDAKRITKAQLSAITAAVSIPAVAIGGITMNNMQQLKGCGMKGIAVSGAVFGATDIEETCRKLREKSKYVVTAKTVKTALSIAGSDASGGAGIQADIKTMTMNGVYAMTAITALTAQNTLGVSEIMAVSPEFLARQIEAVFEDIRPDAVKIGMAASATLIHTIAEELKKYKAENIVVDPVMVATSGARLMAEDAVAILERELLPLASLVTPNILEASILSGMEIQNHETMICAAEKINRCYGCNVLLKGGHSIADADDLLYADGKLQWFRGKRIENTNTHGTGCTLSSAIAAGLAKGYSLERAVEEAKNYLSGALSAGLDLGKGAGPLNHAFKIMNWGETTLKSYTTQMDAARKGILTPQLEIVAKKENMPVEKMMQLVAEGKVAICANKHHTVLNPEGVGSMLRTKINVNLGISRDCKDYNIELQKVMHAVELGAEAIMDLSSHGNTQPFRRKLTGECPAMIGTVPIYDSVIHYQRDLATLTARDFIDVIRLHAEDGVDFVTLHCGITRKTIEQIRSHKRKMNIVSRGGSLVFAWMSMTGEENPFYEYFDEILDICEAHDVTISLGDACRPGCLADATDVCQIEELVRLGELTKRAWAHNVQVMVEGPGHVPLNQVAANMQVQQTLCMGAPFYVLGPIVTDIAPGYDHITAAIGGAVAAMNGAAFLCYVTPAEHLALPNVEDVKQGIIASKIAAHAADIAKGITGARDRDDKMADARQKLDWDAQFACAIDPETARAIRDSRMPEEDHSDTCSMCGKFCAVRSMNKALAGDYIDIL